MTADPGHLADETPDPVGPLRDINAEDFLGCHDISDADVRSIDHRHPFDRNDSFKEGPVFQSLFYTPVGKA